MSKRDSAEYRAFRKCFCALVDGITDPGWLAIQLYSKELIGPDIRTEAQKPAISERVKIVNILSAVEEQIVVSPATKFREFLDVLQNEPSLKHLATILENTHQKLLGLCTTMSISSSSLPQHPPSNSSPSPPPAKRPRTDILQHLATRLENTHSELVGVSQPTSTSFSLPVDTYVSYLKSVYTREKLQVYDKWPQVESKKYINLALIQKKNITKREADQCTRDIVHGNIDGIKMSKRATDIDQIAQLPDGSHPKCILVEGAPGVGKSTFAWKLCRKWGKGKLLQQYQLVVLLRLRDKSVRAATNISDLFRYYDHQIQQAAVEEIQRTGGKGVFLLFEGFDELPEELRTKSSIFLDVITGEELPEATVLITSRPWASEFLHWGCKRHISQHIEILGFTKANIQSYLESTIPDDPSLLADLKKYISCYPHINSMMYIPLNSAIVVEVYRNSRKDDTLVPKTMTELYSSLVRSLLLRHLLDHPVHGKKRRWRVRSFNDLPQDVHQQLCELGRIAYEGILHDQQVIFSDLPEDLETLGLMQCAPELYADEGAAVSYNFLHLTVQEYLAAFHLSQQPLKKQIEHFREYKEEEEQQQQQHHFHMVLRFLSGLRKFSGYSSEVLNTLCVERSISDSTSDGESGDDPASVVHEVTFDTLHWLFEAQDNDVIDKLLGSSDIQLERYSQVTPFDWFVLGYCVSHSNCAWKIILGFCNIGDEGVEMLVRGAVEEETHCTGGISEINLILNCITSEGMKHLLKVPNQLINKLKTLNLFDNKLDSESCAVLAHLIPHVPHLKKLNLSDNRNIGQGGAVPLITSLTAHNSLEKLVLYKTGIGVEDLRALSELLSSFTSLKELNISDNDLPPEAVELIISGLHHYTTLKWLNMRDSHFSLQNTISLASVLRINHTLVHLNLGQCDIDSDGACQIASAVCTNDTLQKLYLERNPIGGKGATAFAKTLRTNHTLVDLNLAQCDIDSDGTCQLASPLCTNDTLQELDLKGNPIGIEGATAFAEMLLKNKSLKKLNLRDDSIGEEGARKLIDSLTHNTTVEELELHAKYKSSFASSRVDRVKFGELDLKYWIDEVQIIQ